MRKLLIALLFILIAVPAYAEKPITLYLTVVYNQTYHQLWELSVPRTGGHIVLENNENPKGGYRCEANIIDLHRVVWDDGCGVKFNYTRGTRVTQDIWALVVPMKGVHPNHEQLAWDDTILEATRERFRREALNRNDNLK